LYVLKDTENIGYSYLSLELAIFARPRCSIPDISTFLCVCPTTTLYKQRYLMRILARELELDHRK